MPLPDENRITYFAQTDARNKMVPFGIKAKDRTRHVYTIGKTGMGKSTLLENMAIQDIQKGEGLAFIDPHGKTAEYLLDFIPEERIKDVLYFAPFDMEYPVAFNVMEDVGPDKRHLVVAGLMSAFKKIWVDAWSARMEYILGNTLLALLEYPGATLLAVNKMLSDKEFRKKVVENVMDPSVKSFWVDEFAKYTDRFAADATPAIQNKVGQFTSNPLVRNIVGQPNSTFDLRKIMDEKKILIINLSKGRVGEGNANLLGSMLITKIYLAAMSRADVSETTLARLPNFYLYVDEFQSFANESFADILSEARKYKLNLTIAHQYIEQMSEEVRDAVFGNVGTMIVFRVGPFDAEVFEKEFMPTFVAEDFVNLGMRQIYLKLMIDGVGSSPFSATTMAPIAKPPISFKEQTIQMSRQQFGRPRHEVEEAIAKQIAGESKDTKPIASDVRAPRQDFDRKNGGNGSREFSRPHTEQRSPVGAREIPKEQRPPRDAVVLSDWAKKQEEESKKQTGTEDHLSGLRRTLAGVLGTSDMLQHDKKDVLPPVETKQVVGEVVKAVSAPKAAPTTPHAEKVSYTPKKHDEAPVKKDTNSANKEALAAILAQLKQKEEPSPKEPEATPTPVVNDSTASEAVHGKGSHPHEHQNKKRVPRDLPEHELRKMLEVADEDHESKK